jgi:hypothetical protein
MPQERDQLARVGRRDSLFGEDRRGISAQRNIRADVQDSVMHIYE